MFLPSWVGWMQCGALHLRGAKGGWGPARRVLAGLNRPRRTLLASGPAPQRRFVKTFYKRDLLGWFPSEEVDLRSPRSEGVRKSPPLKGPSQRSLLENSGHCKLHRPGAGLRLRSPERNRSLGDAIQLRGHSSSPLEHRDSSLVQKSKKARGPMYLRTICVCACVCY